MSGIIVFQNIFTYLNILTVKLREIFGNRIFKTPKNIYEAVYPLYIQSVLTGTLPYTYNKKKKQYETSTIILVLDLLYMTIFTILFLRSSTESTVDVTENSISNLSGWFELYSQVLSVSIATIINCINRKTLVQMFKKINMIDLQLSQIGEKTQYKSVYYFCVIGVLLSWIELAITFPTDYVFLIQNESILYMISTYTPITINGFTKVQYVLFIFIIKERYKLLNNNITSLKHKLYNNETTTKNRNLKHLLNNFDMINKIYYDLCKIVFWLNSAFGIQTFITFTNAMSITTTQSYLCYNNFVKLLKNYDEGHVISLYLAVQWSGLQIMEILFFIYHANKVILQVRTFFLNLKATYPLLKWFSKISSIFYI